MFDLDQGLKLGIIKGGGPLSDKRVPKLLFMFQKFPYIHIMEGTITI